jgi:hypothetical protein
MAGSPKQPKKKVSGKLEVKRKMKPFSDKELDAVTGGVLNRDVGDATYGYYGCSSSNATCTTYCQDPTL